MTRANVPKFGNWESDDNVPYTVYFDKARKSRGGKMINPNDPRENPDMFADNRPSSAPAPPSRHKAQPEESIGRARGGRGAANNESTHQPYGGRGTGTGRSSRPPSVGSEYSIERSPLHPNHQGRQTGKGNQTPSWEGKKSYESSHGTPSRLKPKTPSHSDVAIPKFGEWDVNKPESADNYTYIFNKNARGANAVSDSVSSYNSATKQQNADDNAKFSQRCCFPWGK